MDNNIQRKLRIGNVLKIVVIFTIILALPLIVLGAVLNISPILGIGLFSFLFALVSICIYIEKFMSLNKSVKYLNKYGFQDMAADVNTTEYNLPISKISMGNQVFYANNPPSIIPYAMIVWVYIQQTKYMGVIPMEENINLHCRDGKTFQIKANRNELNILLQQIQMYSPDLILGYGNAQMKQYNIITKNFKIR